MTTPASSAQHESVSETAKKWFIMSRGQIQGPYDPNEVESLLSAMHEPLVWGRGLSEWMAPVDWRQNMHAKGAALTEPAPGEEAQWKYRLRGAEHGPVTYADLLAALRKVDDYAQVDIAGEGFSGWKEIYALQKIVDELGITRRAHPRVPIMGNLITEDSKGGKLTFRVVTISEGGLGLNAAIPFPIGHKFRGVLQSSNLFADIHCTCEVVYLGEDGYTGLRFTHLPSEAEAAVIEYVNKFKDLGSL